MSAGQGARMTDIDRLRTAADRLEWSREESYLQDRATANLLLAAADMAVRHPAPECVYGAGRCPEGKVVDAALVLAKVVLNDGD